MDWKSLISTALTYGKGPAIRAIVWIIVALLGKHGVSEAQAGDLANTLWPLITAAVMGIAALIWSVKSDKKLDESTLTLPQKTKLVEELSKPAPSTSDSLPPIPFPREGEARE